MQRVIVIGGGPAGIMAAITAAQNGHNVTIAEKRERPARKLLITGKGRCNVTNNCDNDTLIANVPKNGRFLYSAFSNWSSRDTMDFFEQNGVPLKTERGNRVFPVSDKAVDIVDCLISKAKRLGVKFIHSAVTDIVTEDSSVSAVMLENGEKKDCDAVVLATGGKSYSKTGSTGDGYAFARRLGHTVTDIQPSLVPLNIHEGFCTSLMGLSLKNVTLSIFEGGKVKPIYSEMGEMLFTHFGISGPIVLSASAHMRHMGKKEYMAKIDLKPALSNEQLDKRLQRDFSESLNKNLANSLDKLLPQKLIPVVIKLSGVNGNIKINQLTKADRRNLCETLKGITLHITSFRDIDEAIITSGGIKTGEINPATMESKLIRGLYFAGEIIDVDAYTGGFNLQIAFSTGRLAGGSI